VKEEPFYAPLITATIPRDPNQLQTRLHQRIRQHDTSVVDRSTIPKAVYFADDCEDEDSEIELQYTKDGKPFFKRRIMGGSSSFLPTDYRTNPFSRQRRQGRFGSFRSQGNMTGYKPVSITSPKNPTDRSGRVML